MLLLWGLQLKKVIVVYCIHVLFLLSLIGWKAHRDIVYETQGADPLKKGQKENKIQAQLSLKSQNMPYE